MKMLDQENLKLIAIVWGVTVALTVAAYNFVIVPQVQAKQSLKKQLVDKKHLYEFAQDMSDDKKRQELVDDMEKLRSELSKYVVGFENSSNLTFDISRIANEKKVSSFSIRAGDYSKSKTIGTSKDLYENHVKIKFNAGFSQFAAMLNALERHRPVFFIEDFKINRAAGNNTNDNSVEMNISFLMKKSQGKLASL
jgi:hypothetical protein